MADKIPMRVLIVTVIAFAAGMLILQLTVPMLLAQKNAGSCTGFWRNTAALVADMTGAKIC